MNQGIGRAAGQGVEYLRLSLTDRCNLRCIYCVPPGGVRLLPRDNILRFEEVERLVRLLVGLGIRKIRLTGGEPLIRTGVAGLISRLTSMDKVEEVTLTTNGVRLARMAGDLWDAGLRRINVSLDSLDQRELQQITGSDCLEKVWQGLRAAQRIGFDPIKINVVVIKGVNDHQIPGFAALARKERFHVRFIEYMPVGRGNGWSRERFSPSKETISLVSKLGKLTPVARRGLDGPARCYRLEGAKGGIGFISPMSDHFCHMCNRLRLTPHGSLRTCLFSDQQIDLRGPLRSKAPDHILLGIMKRALAEKRSRIGRANLAGGSGQPMYRIGG